MQNKEIISKLSHLAFVTSIVGLCLLGVCPAFGAIAIAIPIVLKNKKAPMDEEIIKQNKKATIMGAVSIVLFIIDVVVAFVLASHFGL